MTKRLADRFPPKVLDLLKQAGQVAEEKGVRVCLVGGVVRDLLLGLPNLDLDLVVEGDGLTFAEALADRIGGEVKRHRRFGTATIMLPDGLKLDVATARTEVYEHPAALPRVQPNTIEEDLGRRDFTINALALDLGASHYGRLIDPFGGLRDLRDGIVRALHEQSYTDDPTRIFRAVRFEARYGFKISQDDEKRIRKAVRSGLLMRLSDKRRFTELKLLLQEAAPIPPLKRLEELSVLRAFHPKLAIEGTIGWRLKDALAWAEALPLPYRPSAWKLYLLALLAPLPPRSARMAGRRLGLPHKLLEEVFTNLKAYRALKRGQALKPSRVHRLCRAASVEALLLAGSESERTRKAIAGYLAASQGRAHLRGDDLKALGIAPGPIYREILEALQSARLDGLVRSREEELRYLKRRFGHVIAHQRRLIHA